MRKSLNFQSNEDSEWEFAGEGIQRKIYGYDEKVMLVKVRFQKSAVGALHQHHHSQVSYVESGVFELTIGEKQQVLKQGDGFYVPPNTIHGSKCLEAGILIDVFSPLREDFINE